jgi:two-component system sensor histidine kinase UhpB
MPAMSLRFRIVAAIALVLLVGSALGLAFAGWRARHWLWGELASAQASGELIVMRAYADLPHQGRPEQALADLIATFNGNRHLKARLVARGGRTLAQSLPELTEAPPAWFVHLLGVRINSVRLSAPDAQGHVVELAPVDVNDLAALWSEFLDLSLVLALFCGGGAGLVFVVVGGALRPVRALGEVLPRIGAGDYAIRARQAGPPELASLARGVNEMAARLEAMRARNRALEEQMLTLQDEERADIARDLHDEIGPHLFAANVDATMTASLLGAGRSEAALVQVRSIQSSIAHIQRRVRDILGRLRPPRLVELGLAAAVSDLIDFWRARRPELTLEADLAADDAGLSELVQETAYRLVQESLSNAVRHGAGKTISVRLAASGDALIVEVANDGPPAAGAAPGFGLTGMRERVAELGGTFEAGPALEGGWRMTARLPLATSNREQAA